jgi:Dullard-like phosphatase family protein
MPQTNFLHKYISTSPYIYRDTALLVIPATIPDPTRPFFTSHSVTMAFKILPKLRVVFDLDECLVHSIDNYTKKLTFKSPPKSTVHMLPKIDILGSMAGGHVLERPHLHAGLEMIKESKKAEIFLFTAGTGGYANEVLNHIDPDRKYFTKVWSREDCSEVNYNYTKDLKKLKEDFIPERTLLIDNQLYSFFLQPENGYLIEHFQPNRKGDNCDSISLVVDNYDDDNHLLTACEFVTKQLVNEADVRVELKKRSSIREEHKKRYEFDLDEYLIKQEKEKKRIEKNKRFGY